jgi:hypothetical protein
MLRRSKARITATRRRASLVIALLTLATAFLFAAPAQAQALPPSLQGENFFAFEGPFSMAGEIEIDADCSATAGQTFTIAYTASGIAVGPYPGPYTESGTITVLLTATPFLGFASGIVTEWTARFTINSLAGRVTGDKDLSEAFVASSALCLERFPLGFGASTNVENARATLHYEATIRTATGTFVDQGEASASTQQICFGPGTGEGCEINDEEIFSEHFFLSTGVLPIDTSGKATGGGQVGSRSDPFDGVTFGFNVRKDENETRLKGNCNVLDHATGTHVKCLTVTDYQQIGNTATWEGMAEVNGVEEHYRITVQDNGEPNRGVDMFSIVTDSYEAAGNVPHGNVQLHKQALAP